MTTTLVHKGKPITSMSDLLIIQGENYLAAAGMHNSNEAWEWLMDAVDSGTVNLEAHPVTAADRGRVIDLFDAWADAPLLELEAARA